MHIFCSSFLTKSRRGLGRGVRSWAKMLLYIQCCAHIVPISELTLYMGMLEEQRISCRLRKTAWSWMSRYEHAHLAATAAHFSKCAWERSSWGFFSQLHECISVLLKLYRSLILLTAAWSHRVMRFLRGKGVSASAFMSNATIAQKHTN